MKANNIVRSKIITCDFETYWSKEFTLSSPNYNTSSYVRDKQFAIHCMAIAHGEKSKTHVYRGDDIEKVLRDIDWENHILLAQNTAFDGFIIAHHFKIIPGYYLDTMSMARALHNERSFARLAVLAPLYSVGDKSKTYLAPTKGVRVLPQWMQDNLEKGCIQDVNLCRGIAMQQLNVFPQDELDLIDHTLRMFTDSPLKVDLKLAKKALQTEMYAKRIAILKSGVTEDVLQSNPKLAEAFKALGIEPPSKISEKTHIHSWSFNQSDADFMGLQEHEDVRVCRLIAGRLAIKSSQMETRSNRLIQAGETGGLPVGYNYYAAKTGRWGGTNKLNLHNLPRVDPDNPQPSDSLRRAIIAPKDHVLVVVDSAQIEARINAWLAGQNDLLEQFRLKKDPYCKMASDIYKRPITKADKLERFIGKVAILGLGYGMGAKKFQTTLALGTIGPAVEMELAICHTIVNLYRSTNIQIVRCWEQGTAVLRRMSTGDKGKFMKRYDYEPGVIWLPNGMRMNYPGISTVGDNFEFNSHGYLKKIYGALLVENMVQALARIVLGLQLLWINEELKSYKLKKNEVAKIVMFTHDELVSCVPERLAFVVLAMMRDLMRSVPNGFEGLPLDAEGAFAENYSK